MLICSGIKHYGVNHHKIMVLDATYAIVGSANMTDAVANRNNRDNIVYLFGKRDVRTALQIFEDCRASSRLLYIR